MSVRQALKKQRIKAKKGSDEDKVLTALKIYCSLQREAKIANEAFATAKAVQSLVIMRHVKKHGILFGDKGSKKILMEVDFAEKPIELQFQNRLGVKLIEERAEEILKAKGLYKKCTDTKVTFNEKAIEQAYHSKKISKKELDEMLDKTETEVLVVKETK